MRIIYQYNKPACLWTDTAKMQQIISRQNDRPIEGGQRPTKHQKTSKEHSQSQARLVYSMKIKIGKDSWLTERRVHKNAVSAMTKYSRLFWLLSMRK